MLRGVPVWCGSSVRSFRCRPYDSVVGTDWRIASAPAGSAAAARPGPAAPAQTRSSAPAAATAIRRGTLRRREGPLRRRGELPAPRGVQWGWWCKRPSSKMRPPRPMGRAASYRGRGPEAGSRAAQRHQHEGETMPGLHGGFGKRSIAAAAIAATLTLPARAGEVSLTIYNSDFALVKETRTLALQQGA